VPYPHAYIWCLVIVSLIIYTYINISIAEKKTCVQFLNDFQFLFYHQKITNKNNQCKKIIITW